MYIIKCQSMVSNQIELKELPSDLTLDQALAVAVGVQKDYDRFYIETGRSDMFVRISLIGGEVLTGANAYERAADGRA